MPLRVGVFLFFVLLSAPAAWPASRSVTPDDVVRPVARLETRPVPNRDDAADDPAIWVHPVSPELSLILGTDKQGGLHLYDMDGSPRGTVGEGTKPNNVDVLYGHELGRRRVDLAIATTRSSQARGLKIWAINAKTRELSDVTAGDVIEVFEGREPYGCCAYRSERTGQSFAFVTSKDGVVEQYELRTERGRVAADRVGTFKFDSAVEGCVADEELGFVYVGEEKRGVWKFPAEPARNRRGELIARVGQNGLTADVEGLAIYYGKNRAGYLIVSSQGNNTFKIYERTGTHRYVRTIAPRSGRLGDVQETDGIAVTSRPTSPTFPKGLFIAQDGRNEPRQNFKLFAWEDIAGADLVIDTGWSPRR